MLDGGWTRPGGVREGHGGFGFCINEIIFIDVLLQKATFYLSCWMDIPTINKTPDSNPEKLMFKLPID